MTIEAISQKRDGRHMSFILSNGVISSLIFPLVRFTQILIVVFSFSWTLTAQEQLRNTVMINLDQAQQLFAKNNLRLLAAKFSIDASRASILQAELWNNPNLAIEQNVYNQFTKRYFDVTSTGNTEVQLQQLFLLAGKRGKQIKLAEINSRITEQTFYDILRTLNYQLRSDFFDLYFIGRSLSFYDESIAYIQQTVDAAERMREKQAILLSEVMRLKSLLFSLQKERLNLVNQLSEKQLDLHILLYDSSTATKTLIPQLHATMIDSLTLDGLTLQEAIASAMEHRPDYKIAQENVKSEEANLALQKALSVPDITLGGRWSRAGSYIPEYYAFSIAIDLPLFNRNQGNIQISENTLEANKRLKDNMQLTIKKEVTAAYRNLVEIDKLYKAFNKKFTEDYTDLVAGMVSNYEKRNIGIIEFTDFFESYRNSIVQFNQLQNDRLDAFAALNYAVGTSFVKF